MPGSVARGGSVLCLSTCALGVQDPPMNVKETRAAVSTRQIAWTEYRLVAAAANAPPSIADPLGRICIMLSTRNEAASPSSPPTATAWTICPISAKLPGRIPRLSTSAASVKSRVHSPRRRGDAVGAGVGLIDSRRSARSCNPLTSSGRNERPRLPRAARRRNSALRASATLGSRSGWGWAQRRKRGELRRC